MLVAGFVALTAGSLGCATMAALNAADNHSDFYNRPALTDTIVAIGRPDPALTKDLGHPGAVAFIGEKNTYLIYRGGEELDRIAHLSLDWQRLQILEQGGAYYLPYNSPVAENRLYLKDRQIWGNLLLVYDSGKELPAAQSGELVQAGFHAPANCKCTRYEKTVKIEGAVYPRLQLSESQVSRLGMRRPLALYNPRDAKPPTNVGATLMVPVAVVADIVLIPVYLGVGVVILVGSAFGH